MRTVLKPFNKSLIVLGLTSCLTTLQFASPAYAQDPGSVRLTREEKQMLNETIYATPSILLAPQSGFVIDAGYAHSESEVQIKNLDGKADSTLDSGKTSVAYGLNPHFLFGLGMGYASGKAKADFAVAGQGAIQTSNSEGPTDPNIFIAGRMNFGSVSVIGGLDYLVSTGKSELQRKANQVSDSNTKSGGSEVTPIISVFTNSRQNMMLGSSLSYNFKTERKTEIKDPSGFVAEGKTKGGNESVLNLFIESPQNTHSFGAVLSYRVAESSKKESVGTVEIKGSQMAQLLAFANIQATKTFYIIPAAGYNYFINDKDGNTDLKSQSSYSGQLNIRLAF